MLLLYALQYCFAIYICNIVSVALRITLLHVLHCLVTLHITCSYLCFSTSNYPDVTVSTACEPEHQSEETNRPDQLARNTAPEGTLQDLAGSLSELSTNCDTANPHESAEVHAHAGKRKREDEIASTAPGNIKKPKIPADSISQPTPLQKRLVQVLDEAQSEPIEHDEDEYFLMSLLPQLRSLGEEKKLDVKIEIQQLLRRAKFPPRPFNSFQDFNYGAQHPPMPQQRPNNFSANQNTPTPMSDLLADGVLGFQGEFDTCKL